MHLTDSGFIHVDEDVGATVQRLENDPPNPLQIRVNLQQYMQNPNNK